MTFSIVARDPQTGEMGVAVQTCMFAVGSIVPWARAGVGAVATQAITEAAYGPRCLDAMASGATAADAFAGAREQDPMHVLRQVGVVDACGGAMSYTGDLCVDCAGGLVGDGYAVQGNMLASVEVWPAMAAAYESTTAPFVDRLFAALQAGEAAGGDARGRMSAAVLVVAPTPFPDASGGIWVDVRVDDSDDPIGALGRLLHARLAFVKFNEGLEQLLGGDAAGAVATIEEGLRLRPGEGNLRSLLSGALAASGEVDRAREVMLALVAERPTWAVALRGFAAKGLLPMPDGVDLDSVLGDL